MTSDGAVSDNPSLSDPEAATVRLSIDLSALAWNWRKMRDLSGSARCGAAVKADAYGVGMVKAAARLSREGCKDFFVADANEGARLRRIVPGATIYVLNGAFDGAIATLRSHTLVPVLNSPDQVSVWRSHGGGAFALHIDTGMNRLGVTPAEARQLAEDPTFGPQLVLSHFACSDMATHPLNRLQAETFASCRLLFPHAEASLANSAGILSGADIGYDLTRPGIALYGGEAISGLDNPMRPVVTAQARVLMVRTAKAGQTVSYGATATLTRDSRIAVCGAGYADGYHRAGSGSGVALRTTGTPGAKVGFSGHLLPVIGRVTMDLTMVDVTDLPDAALAAGDWVELFGPTISVDDAARAAGTIGYEMLTGMGRRHACSYLE